MLSVNTKRFEEYCLVSSFPRCNIIHPNNANEILCIMNNYERCMRIIYEYFVNLHIFYFLEKKKKKQNSFQANGLINI